MSSDRGRSLTPKERADEVAGIGMWDGLMSGACTLLPTSVGVWYGTNYSPNFAKYTNWQSRTAIVIMPPLFMFAFSSEQKINHRMREMARESEHSTKVSEWAEQQQKRKEEMKKQREALMKDSNQRSTRTTSAPNHSTLSETEREKQLAEIYRKGVENSGTRIVPGSTLGLHHRIANFWQENPFKILVALSVPAVGVIFKTRASKSHLQLQSVIMHTRVFGQFSVITMLLTLMGFKAYMDANGKFVTEEDAQVRIEDMKAARIELLERLRQDKDNEDYINDLKIRAKKERAEQKSLERKKRMKEKDKNFAEKLK